MTKFKSFLLLLLTFFSIVLLLCNPYDVSSGAIKGLAISAEIIIPSLFIFSVVGIFIVSTNCICVLNDILSPFSRLFFGLNGDLFLVFLISLVSGYPVGSKLIDNLAKQNKITETEANKMLCYCVNGGPAFIISAIGTKVFGSKTLGLVLFASHVLSSFVLAAVLRGKNKNKNKTKNTAEKFSASDAFVSSVGDAAQSMLNLCAFVVLFSVVFEILSKYNLKVILPFLEVTVGIISTKNLFFASFLLGFGGISVQLQVLSLIKNFKVKKLKFFVFRIIHGSISAIITFLITKLLKISVSVLSNNQSFLPSLTNLNLCASVFFLLTGIFFVFSLKKVST